MCFCEFLVFRFLFLRLLDPVKPTRIYRIYYNLSFFLHSLTEWGLPRFPKRKSFVLVTKSDEYSNQRELPSLYLVPQQVAFICKLPLRALPLNVPRGFWIIRHRRSTRSISQEIQPQGLKTGELEILKGKYFLPFITDLCFLFAGTRQAVHQFGVFDIFSVLDLCQLKNRYHWITDESFPLSDNETVIRVSTNNEPVINAPCRVTIDDPVTHVNLDWNLINQCGAVEYAPIHCVTFVEIWYPKRYPMMISLYPSVHWLTSF